MQVLFFVNSDFFCRKEDIEEILTKNYHSGDYIMVIKKSIQKAWDDLIHLK